MVCRRWPVAVTSSQQEPFPIENLSPRQNSVLSTRYQSPQKHAAAFRWQYFCRSRHLPERRLPSPRRAPTQMVRRRHHRPHQRHGHRLDACHDDRTPDDGGGELPKTRKSSHKSRLRPLPTEACFQKVPYQTESKESGSPSQKARRERQNPLTKPLPLPLVPLSSLHWLLYQESVPLVSCHGLLYQELHYPAPCGPRKDAGVDLTQLSALMRQWLQSLLRWQGKASTTLPLIHD
mmetsp:Transcript_38270/g.70661  ORF Transcript_38270/g.70661 Transcript_38270/m.70661 type:complete len:234 (-) Transcript_38270:1349-2050(-)